MLVTAALSVSGCKELSGAGASSGSGSGSSTATGAPAPADRHATSPLHNSDGTKPGLAPLTTAADRAAGRKLIAGLRTKGRGPKTGYARDKFGYAWMDTADGVPLAHNGCDTRNDLLKRDGENLRLRAGSTCVVIAMTLHDPYTGKTIEWRKQQATDVQIDHVVPLSYSWQMGSSGWPESKRKQLANDVLNLIPVDGRTNSAKGDSGPASWLPPNKQIRCAYVVRFAEAAHKYELSVTASDRQMMLKQCGG